MDLKLKEIQRRETLRSSSGSTLVYIASRTGMVRTNVKSSQLNYQPQDETMEERSPAPPARYPHPSDEATLTHPA